MALYSWFSKNNNRHSKKSVRSNNNLLKASESAKYIENYTMWPTAKVKQGIEITLPVYEDLKEQSDKEPKEEKSKDKLTLLNVALIVNK